MTSHVHTGSAEPPANTYEMLESEVTSGQVFDGVAVVALLVRAKGM